MILYKYKYKKGSIMNTPIHDFLEKYASLGAVRCHMPGGKGQNNPFDITEISGADSLYESSGIILESEKNAASLFGSGAVCYSCGGSTLAIQAMLAVAAEVTGKKRIAAGRYCHKSLINTAVLLGLRIDWLYPDSFLGTDISPEAVEAAIDEDTAAVFINSIDYYGSQADIAGISAVCRKKGVLLLVDNAHGAYRVFNGTHPILQGADMTADSAHKTLPALTGAAYLHLKDKSLFDRAKAAMFLFGSSSPSYLILDSLDLCNRFIEEKKSVAKAALEGVSGLKERLSGMGFILRKSDPMRITVDACAAGYSGDGLAELLREKGAECEMSDGRYVVLLFSVAQPEGDFKRLEEIFASVAVREPIQPPCYPVIKPERVMLPREAYFSRSETVPTEKAVGRICAGVVSPCPPCVPVVMPGEIISEEAAGLLKKFGIEEIRTVI